VPARLWSDNGSKEEGIMANDNDDSQRKHGRQYDQMTHDGTGSAASVGPGGTGDLDKSLQQSEQGGSQQSGGRMDDLLAGNPDDNANDFRGAGELQAGLGSSMQSERGRANEKEVPPGDARISHKSDRGS
jgi:hypothetical protein